MIIAIFSLCTTNVISPMFRKYFSENIRLKIIWPRPEVRLVVLNFTFSYKVAFAAPLLIRPFFKK